MALPSRLVRWSIAAVAAVSLFAFGLFSSAAYAQELGTLTIALTDTDGAPVGGVAVELVPSARLGIVRGYTDARGMFSAAGLRPGAYALTLSPASQLRLRSQLSVISGRVTAYNVRISGGAQIVATQSTNVSANVTTELVSSLPLGSRNFTDLSLLVPGVVQEGNGISVAGGMARDNRYLIDGMPAQDWGMGSPALQYLPDSLEGIQVQTSNYGAEYGRTTGGVVNFITRSQPSQYGGAFRLHFADEGWGATNEIDQERGVEPAGSGVNLQGVLGGPIIKDKLWFFGGYRGDSQSDQRTLQNTGLPYDTEASDNGAQVSLNYKLNDAFRLKAFYSQNWGDDTRASRDGVTPGTIVTPSYAFTTGSFGLDRSFGSNLLDVYGSYFGSSLKDNGSLAADFADSPLIDFSTGYLANQPLGDGTVPVKRNSLTLGANFSWSAPGLLAESGHQFKFGAEYFSGSQEQSSAISPTFHAIVTDLLKDNQGRFILNDGIASPFFRPLFTTAIGSVERDPGKFSTSTTGFYAQDNWKLNDRWSFNLGVRLDSYKWDFDGDELGSKTTISPRLSATWNTPWDDGWYISGAYSRLNSGIFEKFHGGGLLAAETGTLYVYTGPQGFGNNFTPGFSQNNYVRFADFDERALKTFEDSLAPYSYDMFSLSAWHSWSAGSLRFGYLNKVMRNAVETGTGDPVTFSGSGNNQFEFQGVRIFSTDALTNKYQSVWTELRHRLNDKLHFGLNYTYQLDHSGNYEADKKPELTAFGDYPEIFSELRHYPVRNLEAYQPNDFALWFLWNAWQFNALHLDVAALFHAQSGEHYAYTAQVPITPIQEGKLDAAGRVDFPATQTLYFDGLTAHRHSEKNLRLGATLTKRNLFGNVNAFANFQFDNVLNGQAWKRGPDTTIIPQGPFDADGLPTQFELGPNHGEPTRSSGVQTPRRLTISFGLTF